MQLNKNGGGSPLGVDTGKQLGGLPTPLRPKRFTGFTQAPRRALAEGSGRRSWAERHRSTQIGSECCCGKRKWLWLSEPFWDPILGQNQWDPILGYLGVGEFTTYFRTYFSGDWDVHWGCGLLTHGQMAVRRAFGTMEIAHLFRGSSPVPACREGQELQKKHP